MEARETEFEAALAFVRDYASAVAVAVRRNERLNDWDEFQRYCSGHGLEATRERLARARDIAIAAREYFAGRPEECGLVGEDAVSDAGELEQVSMLFLLDTLECHGWRREFLSSPVSRRASGAV